MDVRRKSALEEFLHLYCPEPEVLIKALGPITRVKRLGDREHLCKHLDPAECYWIVEQGELEIRFSNNKLLTRKRGELVGEAAFYRPATTEHPDPVRGNDIVSAGVSIVCVIDCSKINELSSENRSLWHQTVARVLTKKLDQATEARAKMISDGNLQHAILNRFVCEPGVQAAQAFLRSDGTERIDPENTKAVIWFSDVVGFSNYAKRESLAKTAAHLRKFMDLQAKEIARHQGHIDKFIGDGLMAFWICQDTDRCARHAQGAVTAAIESAKRITDYSRTNELPLDIRIGLHIGDVILGDFGGSSRIGFTLIGDAVNDASRYEQAKDAKGEKLGRVRVSKPLFDTIESRDLRNRFHDRSLTIEDKHHNEFPTYTILET
jgi:class 3 adenylate cyclase